AIYIAHAMYSVIGWFARFRAASRRRAETTASFAQRAEGERRPATRRCAMSLRVGFIGLGNQGKPIAAHLAPSGFATTVYDLAPEPVSELVAGGARAASSPREVGERSDVIGICVPADEHVRAVVYGEDGLLAGTKPGAVIAIHSTILPDTAIEI